MMDWHHDLYQQLRGNKRKTKWIMSLFFLIVVAFGSILGSLVASASQPADNKDVIIGKFLIGSIIVAGLYMLIVLSRSINVVASMNHAGEVTNSNNYPVFHEAVKELCLASGLPYNRFRLFVVNDGSPNAFSIGNLHRKGRGYKGEAAIGVTSGMFQIADKYELQAVLGHEMSHIIDQDTRVETVGIALTSLFAFIGGLCMRLAWYSDFFGIDDNDGDNDDDDNGAVIAIALFIVGIIGWIFSGISYLSQLCLSRNREYLADAGSVNLTRNPVPLISIFVKLERLEQGNANISNMKSANANSNSLYMFNPHGQESFIARMLDTHPPLIDRIKRLREM